MAVSESPSSYSVKKITSLKFISQLRQKLPILYVLRRVRLKQKTLFFKFYLRDPVMRVYEES